MRLRFAVALGMAAIPSLALAQEKGAGAERTAVYMQAGYSTGSWGMDGAALGGMLVRDLTSRLSVEASASHLGQGMGSSGLSASAALLVHLGPARAKAMPYLAAGGGIYRASFDMGSRRFQGPTDMRGGMMDRFGMMGVTSRPADAPWAHGQMPHFYGRRLGSTGAGPAADRGERSFTDPAIVVGGGLRVDLGSRLYLKPDVRALVVTSGGEATTRGLFTVNFGYRF